MAFAFLGPLYFYIIFIINLPLLKKWGFDQNCIESTDQVGEKLYLNNIEPSNPWTQWLGQTSNIFQSYTKFHISVRFSVLQQAFSPWCCGFAFCVGGAQPLAKDPLDTPMQTLGPFSFPSATLYSNHTFFSSARPLCSAGIHLWVHQLGMYFQEESQSKQTWH